MIRGIRFIIPNGWGYVLPDVLRCFRVSDRKWIAYYLDFFDANVGSPDDVRFQENGIYTGEELLARSQQFPEYLFILGVFAAFPLLEQPHPISTYEEFIKSDCEALCTIDDAEYVKAYIKDSIELEFCFRAAHLRGYREIEYLTEKNDNGVM